MSSIRPTLLAIGDGAAPTGFARVMHGILRPLAERYDIHHLAVNYRGEPHEEPWKIYPAGLGGDLQGVGRIPRLVADHRPDLVFLLNDLWVLSDYVAALHETDSRAPIVVYCPIDAGPVDDEVLSGLGGIARFVAYTEFGRREVERAVAKIRRRDPGFAFPVVEVLPHGVDVSIFQPEGGKFPAVGLPDRSQAIASLYGDEVPPDAFIVLNANRNQPRKRIDLTIEGFALFADGKPDDLYLHLHMGVEDAGWNVLRLARRHGLEDRLILTHEGANLPAVSDRQLRRIYQAAAVGINTSIAEGWGLVAFEHGATGAAQIVPRHSACAELWDGAGWLLDPVGRLTTEGTLTDGWFVSAEGVAEGLEALYSDSELLVELSRAAHRKASDPTLRWEVIAERWGRRFDEELAAGVAMAERVA
jgi:glycosyltransferase involved in cell wall biosynthesis